METSTTKGKKKKKNKTQEKVLFQVIPKIKELNIDY